MTNPRDTASTHSLVSVVIPTNGRPQYLPRAVESALTCQGDSVEVIVVPNGPDCSWKESLSRWAADERVFVSPIETAHGNVARNHGMSLARGRFIRFLDDDDYLLPDAKAQIVMLEYCEADICSGAIENIDEDGFRHNPVKLPGTKDFVCAATSVSGFTLPVGNLYRRSAIRNQRWDESVARAQDNAWMIDMAMDQEWSWVHCEKPVGVWFQHKASRTSSTRMLRGREEAIIDRLVSLSRALDSRGGLTPARRSTIAEGLWYYIQRGFPSHPLYWSRVAQVARGVDPSSRAPGPLYQKEPFRRIQPLVLQWLLLPIRWATRGASGVLATWREPDYRRQL